MSSPFFFNFGFIIIFWVIALGAAVGLAFIPATMASKKGYSYGGFWAFGFFALIPALIVASVIEDKTAPRPVVIVNPQDANGQTAGYIYVQTKDCTQCGVQIPKNSAFCSACGAKMQ